MEADLVARPRSGGHTQLVPKATYRPPGSLPGVVGDALFGRVVTRSTAEAFTCRLAQAMEGAITNQPSLRRLALRHLEQGRQVAMPADQDGLMTLARKVHADADAERLAHDLGTLAHALASHLDRELPHLARLPPAEVRVLRRERSAPGLVLWAIRLVMRLFRSAFRLPPGPR